MDPLINRHFSVCPLISVCNQFSQFYVSWETKILFSLNYETHRLIVGNKLYNYFHFHSLSYISDVNHFVVRFISCCKRNIVFTVNNLHSCPIIKAKKSNIIINLQKVATVRSRCVFKMKLRLGHIHLSQKFVLFSSFYFIYD